MALDAVLLSNAEYPAKVISRVLAVSTCRAGTPEMVRMVRGWSCVRA